MAMNVKHFTTLSVAGKKGVRVVQKKSGKKRLLAVGEVKTNPDEPTQRLRKIICEEVPGRVITVKEEIIPKHKSRS